MQLQKINWLIVWVVVCFVYQTQAQVTKENVVIINGIYDAIENKDTPTLIANWVPDMKWYQSTNHFNETEPYASDNKVLNDAYALMENEWENVIFKNMNIQEIEENVVLVTGTLTGRKSKESAIISSEFHHLWWLKDGKVIKFLE
jgi:ketosteroid isomerase-like protein